MVRASRAEAAAHHEELVAAASRLFRDRGAEAVSVPDVMGAIGLTRGGFYKHFESKEALVANAALMPLFEEMRQRVPRDFPRDLAVVATGEGNRTRLSLPTRLFGQKKVTQARFFPLQGLVWEEAAPQPMQTESGQLTLTLTRAEALSSGPHVAEGVFSVGFDDVLACFGDGDRSLAEDDERE